MRKTFTILTYILTAVDFFILMGVLIVTSVGLAINPTYEGTEIQYGNLVITQLSFEEELLMGGSDSGNFYMDGENYLIAIENGMADLIQIGDEVQIAYGRMGFGDSFEYPVVMLAKDDIVFLEEEDGIQNLIDMRNAVRNELILTRLWNIGVFVILLGGSIYWMVSRKALNEKMILEKSSQGTSS